MLTSVRPEAQMIERKRISFFMMVVRSQNERSKFDQAPSPAPHRLGTRCLLAISSCFPFPADVAKHVRVDVQSDVGHVVEMLTRDEPNDFANLAVGIMASQARKRVGIDGFVLG